MNLYFTRWARAKQEYIIAGAMQISFDSPPGWWHHDIWYLRECNASSKLTVLHPSINYSVCRYTGLHWHVPLLIVLPMVEFCVKAYVPFEPIWLWKKPPQHPDNLVRLLVDENVTHPDLRQANENPRDSMSCGPSRLRRTMLVQSDLYNVKAPKFVGFIVESRHLSWGSKFNWVFLQSGRLKTDFLVEKQEFIVFLNWLVVSTHLKNISQNGNFPK